MASITSLGVGSGLDLNTMVTQLVALERKPLDQMQSDASRLQTKVSTYGKLQSLLSGLQDAANALTSTSLWNRSTATSANESVVTALGGSNASPGTYSVTVQSLAASQTVSSATAFSAATSVVGSGTLTIDLGSWNADHSAFTPQSGASTLSVSVAAGDSLQTVRDKINAAGGGVSASIVTDSSGARLAIRSSSSGLTNGFRISAADDDGNGTDAAGLSRLAFDPASGANGLVANQSAADAQATVNGIAVSSASNDLSGVVEGITLRLRGTSATAVDLQVNADRTAVSDAVNKFASAYNELAKTISDQTKYDATAKVGGLLQGDSAVGGLLSRLRGVVNGVSGASSRLSRLSDLGLQMQRDGTLNVNSAKLSTAMTDLTELRKALSNSDIGNAANTGLARRFADLATEALGVDGSLTQRTEGLRHAIALNTKRQGELSDRVDRFQQRLVNQFTAMDGQVAKLKALDSYVSQQIAAMNKTTNG